MSAATIRYAYARTIECPYCGAKPGSYCLIVDPIATVGRATSSRPHQARLDAANQRDAKDHR